MKKIFACLVMLLITVYIFAADYSRLCDSQANTNTQKVMKYFNSIYGKKMLTGVMDCAWGKDIDMDGKVYADTKAHAALEGFDFIAYTKSDSLGWIKNGYTPDEVQRAVNWWKSGGLVAFCWHWMDPASSSYNGASYDPSAIKFRIPYDSKNDCIDEKNPDFQYIKKDLDTIASQLQLLQKEGVVVLWRPLHEARGNIGRYSGGKAWFWWGASGSKAYIALWKYMFTYFSKEKGLHNLIWVWNGQGPDWYPGDEYCDIVGFDIYPSQNYNSQGQPTGFNETAAVRNGARENVYKDLMTWCNSSKMAAISECGCVPSSGAIQKSSAKWLYYIVWNDNDNLMDDSTKDNDNFWGGTLYNSKTDKNENSFATDFTVKKGDSGLNKLFADMGIQIK